MKADRYGTWVEQLRDRQGWKSASERKASGADPAKICRGCHHFKYLTYTPRDGGVGVTLRCWHPKSGDGFASRETAGCNLWEGKLA